MKRASAVEPRPTILTVTIASMWSKTRPGMG